MCHENVFTCTNVDFNITASLQRQDFTHTNSHAEGIN